MSQKISKLIKVMGKTRQQFIESVIEKGDEWLAGKLFDERAKAQELREEIRLKNNDLVRRSLYVAEESVIRKINRNLADVLEENGVRPHRYRITYEVKNCAACDSWEYDDRVDEYHCSDFFRYNDDDCVFDTIVETIPFYSYKIVNDELKGIVSDFSKRDFDVVKLADETTGEIVWERDDEEEEEQDDLS